MEVSAPDDEPRVAIAADEFRAHAGGALVAESRALNWRSLRAESYRYGPQHETFRIPAVADHYVIELNVSGSTSEVEQKLGSWRKRRWRRGDLIIYPAGEETLWRWHAAVDTVIFLVPQGRWLRMAAEASERDDAPSLALAPDFSPADSRLARILLLLAEELRAGGPNGPLYADSLADAALVRLLLRHSTRAPRPDRRADALAPAQLKRVFEFVDANLGEAVSVDDLAGVADIGAFAFSRAFRHATGTTPYQFVLARRIERAAELLAASDLSLAEIALDVGFSSQSHFTTAFHRINRITPAAYRRKV